MQVTSSLLILFLLSSSMAIAQNASGPRPGPAAQNGAQGSSQGSSQLSARSSDFSLDALVGQASRDLTRLTQEVRTEANKGEDFDICRVQKLKLQQKYAQWFIQQVEKYREIEANIDAVLKMIKQKIDVLKSAPIETLPVPGQSSAGVQIGYSTIIGYLKNFNARIKTCAPEKLHLLKQAQEDPTLNPLGVAHQQVIKAMETMTEGLNASLKQSGARFEIGFAEAACGYDLELRAQLEIQPGVNKEMKFSLLDGGADFTLSAQEKWSVVFSDQERIAGYSVSGKARYLEMYQEVIDTACAMPEWELVSAADLGDTLSPYMSFEAMNSQVLAAANLIKSGKQLGGTIGLGNKRNKIELRDDCDYGGFKGYAPYREGKKVSVGCVKTLQTVEHAGTLFFFGVGMDNLIYRKAIDDANWTQLGGGDVAAVVHGGVFKNEPYVVYFKTNGQVEAMTASGAKSDEIPLPSIRAGNLPKTTVSTYEKDYCRNAGVNANLAVKFNGVEQGEGGCVREIQVLPFFDDFFVFGIGGGPAHQIFVRTKFTPWRALAPQNVAKLVSVSVDRRGIPEVTYSTSAGKIESIGIR